jgi:hypothetical protein
MADVLNGAAKTEAAESLRLTTMAKLVARSAISDATLEAAKVAVAMVMEADGGSALGEPARDLWRLRTDPAFRQALSKDLIRSRKTVLFLILDALWMGYRTAAASRSVGLPLRVDLTEQDRKELAGYPIVGFTADEIADDLVYTLRRNIDRALALPLSGQVKPDAVPTALAQAGETFANAVSASVGEAHATGVAAAVAAIGRVLTGGTSNAN